MPIIDIPTLIERIIDVDFLNPVAVVLRLLQIVLAWLGIIEAGI